MHTCSVTAEPRRVPTIAEETRVCGGTTQCMRRKCDAVSINAHLPVVCCAHLRYAMKWPGSVARDHWRGVQRTSQLTFTAIPHPSPTLLGKGHSFFNTYQLFADQQLPDHIFPLHEPLETLPSRCRLSFSDAATTRDADCAPTADPRPVSSRKNTAYATKNVLVGTCVLRDTGETQGICISRDVGTLLRALLSAPPVFVPR